MADNYVEYHRQEYEQWKARRNKKRQAELRRRLAAIMARREAERAANSATPEIS